MSKKKLRQSLTDTARSIKDSTDFLAHVIGVAERYRRELVLDTPSRKAELRKSLNVFRRNAGALAQWLKQAHRQASRGPEFDALKELGAAIDGSPARAQIQSAQVRVWLEQALAGSMTIEKNLTKHAPAKAPRIAAEALRATFERHKLKVSYSSAKDQHSAAIKLFCAIALDAGDASVTPEVAKKLLKEAGSVSPERQER